MSFVLLLLACIALGLSFAIGSATAPVVVLADVALTLAAVAGVLLGRSIRWRRPR
jgi:hypothetical protein